MGAQDYIDEVGNNRGAGSEMSAQDAVDMASRKRVVVTRAKYPSVNRAVRTTARVTTRVAKAGFGAAKRAGGAIDRYYGSPQATQRRRTSNRAAADSLGSVFGGSGGFNPVTGGALYGGASSPRRVRKKSQARSGTYLMHGGKRYYEAPRARTRKRRRTPSRSSGGFNPIGW
jgi:hypothetical protein